jgi:hypothetical protein
MNKLHRASTSARAKSQQKSFDASVAMGFALAALDAPPPSKVTRVEAVGELVGRWVLPLEDAPAANRLIELGRIGQWALAALKSRVRKRMLDQSGGRRAPVPLSGRPHVRFVIFSSGREDYDRSRTKIPVDRLQPGRRKRPKAMPEHLWARLKDQLPPVDLNWIRDDTRDAIDLATWQEPAPPGKGCVLVELYRGAT